VHRTVFDGQRCKSALVVSAPMQVLMAQMSPSPGRPDANVDRIAHTLRAHPTGDLAVFPELFLSGYDIAAIQRLACGLDAPAIARLQELAATAATALVVGFAERLDGGGVANAALCLDRDGRIAGVHRKTHLFGAAERATFVAGDALHVVELAGTRVAPLICFEIEFPEPARATVGAGAELLVTIAANMAPYGDDHALASRARALDNRTPHLYVNRVGSEGGLQFVGGSQAIGSDGQVVAGAGDGEAVVPVRVPDREVEDPETRYLDLARPALPVIAAAPHR
jgi:predicted amidohydrolase